MCECSVSVVSVVCSVNSNGGVVTLIVLVVLLLTLVAHVVVVKLDSCGYGGGTGE